MERSRGYDRHTCDFVPSIVRVSLSGCDIRGYSRRETRIIRVGSTVESERTRGYDGHPCHFVPSRTAWILVHRQIGVSTTSSGTRFVELAKDGRERTHVLKLTLIQRSAHSIVLLEMGEELDDVAHVEAVPSHRRRRPVRS